MKTGRNVNKITNIEFGILKYHDRVNKATDIFHNFPRSFDQIIIENGRLSQRLKDQSYWIEFDGLINKEEGIYQLGITIDNVIFHRNFIKK